MWQDVVEKAMDGLSWIGGIVLALIVLPIVALLAFLFWDSPPHLWHSQAARLMSNCPNFSHWNGRERNITSIDSVRSFDVWRPDQRNLEFYWRWHDAANSPPMDGFARLTYVNKSWTVEFFSDDAPGERGCSGQLSTDRELRAK